MKRSIVYLAVAALPLAACEPYEAQRQRLEVSAAFEEAQQHLDNATSGARHVEWTEEAPDHEAYRQQELRRAAEAIGPLLRDGSPSQRYAARILLGEVHASAGRIAARDAAVAASRQGSLGSELTGLASSVRAARLEAAEHGRLDYEQHLRRLADDEAELAEEREAAEAEARQLAEEVERNEQQIAAYREGRREQSALADDLFRREFQASGEEAYELHVEGATASREADRLTAEMERAQAELSVQQGQLQLIRKRIGHLDEQIEALRESAEALGARAAETRELAAEAEARAGELGEELDARLEELVEGYGEGVERRFDEAIGELEEAVEQAEAAQRDAPAQERDSAQLADAAARARIGHVLHQRAVVERGHENLLATLAGLLESADPERAERIAAVAEQTADRAATAAEGALGHLAAALEELDQVAETAESRNERQIERATRRHLVEVNRALAALDEGFESRADEHRERRDALTADD